MITNKEDDRKDQKLGLDVDAFAMQVDQEIDSLFVPGSIAEGAEESASEVQMVDDVEIQMVGDHSSEGTVDPVIGEANVDPSPKGMDVNAFEVQIDKEIDNLFVPADLADMPADQSFIGTAEIEHAALGALQVEAPVMQPSGGHGAPAPDRLEIEAPDQEPAILTSQDETPVEKDEPLQMAQSSVEPVLLKPESELPNLVEDLNIAYLSLDWEFSVENLSKLWFALEALKDFCGKSRETVFLFKLMRSLLHRLKTKPDSVQPEIIEMMRDGHEALKNLLLSNTGPDAREKQKLRNLASRYRVIRDGSVERGDEPEVKLPQVEKPSPFCGFSKDLLADWTSMTKQAFPEWMQGHVLKASELEKALLGEVEGILSLGDGRDKISAVGDLSSKLNRIRSIVEEYLAISRTREKEWKSCVEWLLRFEGNADAAQALPEERVVSGSVVDDSTATVADALPAASGGSGEHREEQIFLFSAGGRRFGILAKHVVKIESVNAKKVGKIVARGHATLADFKPFYRSLKAGLLGAWSGLPSEILKTYQFIPVSIESLGADQDSAMAGGAVLVSSGRNHGVIFVDSGAVDLHNATLTKIKRDNRSMVLGLAEVEPDLSMEVLNMDALLRRHREAGAPEIRQ